MEKSLFLTQLKNDIESLKPYENGYTMSDIYFIKMVYNDLAKNGKSFNACAYAVKRFYDKKKYIKDIIVYEANGLYNVILN